MQEQFAASSLTMFSGKLIPLMQMVMGFTKTMLTVRGPFGPVMYRNE